MQSERVVIRKYENRRLYDTANSRYVNLDEVAQMVRDGVDVQVVDAATGEDLTRVVLAQIITEEAKGGEAVFPLDFLRQMVMASGRAGQDLYQNAYRAFAPVMPFDFLRSLVTPRPTGEVEELRRRVEELEKRLREVSARKSAQKKPRTPR